MLNWICPECGRECSPGGRECPGCADAAEPARRSVSASGGISALARAVERDAGARATTGSNQHLVAVAVLEEESRQAEAVKTAEVAEVEVGFVEEPTAINAEPEPNCAPAAIGEEPTAVSADEAPGIEVAVAFVAEAEPELVSAPAAIVEEVTAADVAEIEPVCAPAAIEEETTAVSADEAPGLEPEVGFEEEPTVTDALAEAVPAQPELVCAIVEEAATADIVHAEPESTCAPAAIKEEITAVSADEAPGVEPEVGFEEEPTVTDAAAEAVPAQPELVCAPAAIVEEMTAPDVAEGEPESTCAPAAIEEETTAVRADQAPGVEAEVAFVEEPTVTDAAAEAAPARPELVCAPAAIEEETTAVSGDEAPGVEAEVAFVEEPTVTDATAETAPSEPELVCAIVEEATIADVVHAEPESICAPAAMEEETTAVRVDEAPGAQPDVEPAEEPTAINVTAEATPPELDPISNPAPEEPAQLVDPVRPALSDASRLAFFEAQQIVAQDLLEVQAEEAAYSSAVGEVRASFRAEPAVMLLTPAGDVLTAPAPPLLHCAPSARPWIAAIPPKNPAGRSIAAAHEPHLAGPSLPRELQSFREAAHSPAARRSKRTAIPAWVLSVLAATAVFLAAGTLIQKLTADRDPKPTAAPPATSQTAVAAAHPLGRFVEVTGLRVVVDLKRHSQLQYVVVNHSATPMSGMALRIDVRSTAAGSNDALFHVAAVVPYLGPFQSKELRTDLDAQLQSTQIPDWDYLKADVQVTPR